MFNVKIDIETALLITGLQQFNHRAVGINAFAILHQTRGIDPTTSQVNAAFKNVCLIGVINRPWGFIPAVGNNQGHTRTVAANAIPH